tara:strand:- start:314 stop:1426 length:1113 start_codon:yes stop_codon:yes gene_type:complete
MAGIGQGHETANQSYQADGLGDGDVLASPTLTNFNERGLMNGVVPITLNKYSEGARNTSTTLNCACSTSGNQSVSVAAGTVLIDGIFYSISAATINVATATAQYETYHTSGGNGVPPTLSANQERIVLAFVDPQVTGNIGLTYGDAIDTSSGNYPTSPSGHLARQTIVLASIRIHYSSNEVRVNKIEDKRVFIRPGPIPFSSLIDASGNAAMPATNFISGDNAGTLPITDLGFLFARDPVGLGSYADGRGGTHLFYQSDLRANQAGMGGAYQITPTHRESIKTDTYTGSQKNITVAYTPLESQDEASTRMIDIVMYKSGTPRFIAVLIQGLDYTVADNVVTINGSLGYTGTPTHVKITYTHAGHTGDVSP